MGTTRLLSPLLLLALFFPAQGCGYSGSVSCTAMACGDRFDVTIVQDTRIPTMPGRYRLVVVGGATPVYEATVVADPHRGAVCSGTWGYCDGNGQLHFNIAGAFRADDLPEQPTFEVFNDSTLLTRATVDPGYDRYWCNGPDFEACNDRQNYKAEVTLEVDYPPSAP